MRSPPRLVWMKRIKKKGGDVSHWPKGNHTYWRKKYVRMNRCEYHVSLEKHKISKFLNFPTLEKIRENIYIYFCGIGVPMDDFQVKESPTKIMVSVWCRDW